MDSLCLSTSERTLVEVREILLESKTIPADRLRPVSARAWERCLTPRVDPRFDQRPQRLSDGEFRVRLERNEPLLWGMARC